MAQPLTPTGPPHGSAAADDRHVESVRQLVAVRRRAAQAARRLDRVSAAIVGWGFVAVAVVAAAGVLPGGGSADEVTLAVVVRTALLVVLYVLAYRTEFVAASGSAVPTQPVLVGLLLTTPTALVPLAVLAGLWLGAVGSPRAGSLAHTLAARALPGWHCLGPVAVLTWAQPGTPSLAHWRVYLVALVSQVVVDAVVAVVRSASLGVPPRDLVRPLSWTFAVDALLASVGVAAVVAADGSWADLVLLAAPIGVVRLLAVDGAGRLAAAVSLEDAWTREQRLARTDAMTGLANRRAWNEAVVAAAVDGAAVGVVVVDLDGLKPVNDVHGHQAGDALIVAAGTVMRKAAEAVAPGSVVARLGGDEFGVLVRDEDATARVAEEVRRLTAASPPVEGAPGTVVLSLSLGHASCPPGGDVLATVTLADERAGHDKAMRRVGRRSGDPLVVPYVVPLAKDQAPEAATSSTSRSSVRTATPVPPTGV